MTILKQIENADKFINWIKKCVANNEFDYFDSEDICKELLALGFISKDEDENKYVIEYDVI